MKILYTSKTPLAGVCEKMTRTVNEYYPEDHQARCLNAGPGKHRWYARDKKLCPTYSIKDPKKVAECLEWADVIHCMANVGAVFFDREDLLDKKVWVYQWHGAQIWPFNRVWKPKHYKSVRFIHIGQGWVESSPEQAKFFKPFFEKHGAIVVPNLVTGDDKLHLPLPWEKRVAANRVAFAPSQRNDDAVNGKGIKVIKEMVVGSGGSLDLICGVPFEACLRRKSVAKLGIDEIVTPMYHLSGLEFLSQGTPCICSYTEQTAAVLMEATGADRMPFINTRPSALQGRIESWCGLPADEKRRLGREAREWFDEFYHPRQIIKKYLAVYERG